SGHTSTGKSVFLNSVIYTLLSAFSPQELELVLIDPKISAFNIYEGIKYLRGKVNYSVDDGIVALKDCVLEIERRKKENNKNPQIVILIDEFSDLVIGDSENEELICRIAKEGKEVGVYIILSSSMVSEKVFTERVKECISKRLVGAVVSRENSLSLLEEEGAELLEGHGDMIYKEMSTREMVRVQTPYVSVEDIRFLKSY
ncbi:MAG: FtsK/SpoIIIE domain-containing protein, partial [Candidatus Dojkabacteria bacterium]|nr:FtsK/SpoIIIE domain-containing protein [Candidatus Dojkabacteria bacterium]